MLDKIKNTEPRKLFCLALLVALGFSLGCSEFIVIGIEQQIANAYGVPLARTGDLMSMFSAAYALCTPVLAVTTGRFKRINAVAVYAVLFCASNVVSLLAPSFEMLLASRVLMGAVSGALLALGVTYIPELVGIRRSATMISLVYAAFSVAMVIATSAGKIVAEALDWKWAIAATVAIAVIVCALLLAALPRSGAGDMSATAREQLALVKEPAMLTGIAIFVFGVGSVYVFYGYITPYLEHILGFGPYAASLVLMAYGVMCFFSNLMSGWLTSRAGIRTLLGTFPVQALLLFALFAVGGNAIPAVVIIMAVALSMYLLSVPCVSLFMKIARDRHPKAITLASALEPMAFNMGIAFGTIVGGSLVTNAIMGYAGAVGGAFSLVALGFTVATVLLTEKKWIARHLARLRRSVKVQRRA